MKRFGLVLLALALSAPALAAQDLLCVRADRPAGAPSYLLIVKNSNPDGTAIILEKNFSVFQSAWQVDYSDAVVTRASDGGPLNVVGAPDPSRIDWDTPEHAVQCFLMYKTYRFQLNESSRGTQGTLALSTELARNPNVPHCPTPVPPPAQQFPVSCSDY